MTQMLDAPASRPTPTPDPAAGEMLVEPQDMHLYDDGPLYELVDGRLVEKHMSDIAQFAADLIDDVLDSWAKPAGAGKVFVESSFQCWPGRPRLVRRPDVAFVCKVKLDGYALGNPHVRLVPDLVVEVVSPNDALDDVFDKVREYHAAGVPLVWVAVPMSRRVLVEPNPDGGGKPAVLTADDSITGGDVLPGFACIVGDLFPANLPPAPPRGDNE